MKLSKVNLQRTKKIGAMLAIEIWMEYPPQALPEYWREAMVERGVGERRRDGTIRLSRRGRRLRAELLEARKNDGENGAEEDSSAVSPHDSLAHGGGDDARRPARNGSGTNPTGEPALGRSWREILARCRADTVPVPRRSHFRSLLRQQAHRS